MHLAVDPARRRWRAMTALDALAPQPRWVAWRIEIRGGKPTKVPYAPQGGRVRADDPSTWGTRAEAEARPAKIVNGQGGGIGFMLGEAADSTALGGVDLDTCRSSDGRFDPWAREVIDRFGSYTEVSPSGTGQRFSSAITPRTCPNCGSQWGRGMGAHLNSGAAIIRPRSSCICRTGISR
jgi:hypothetical protein